MTQVTKDKLPAYKYVTPQNSFLQKKIVVQKQLVQNCCNMKEQLR